MELKLQMYKNRHSLRFRILRIVWGAVWGIFCSWTPSGLGLFYKWREMWLRLFGAKIGRRCHIYPKVKVWQPWRFTMGDDSCLSNGVNIYSVDRIDIGSNVVISEDAFLCTASHDISSSLFELTTAPLRIADNVWVCARAVILSGVKIQTGAVVGCAALVSKDVEPWTVVAGNPAKFIKKRVIEDA